MQVAVRMDQSGVLPFCSVYTHIPGNHYCGAKHVVLMAFAVAVGASLLSCLTSRECEVSTTNNSLTSVQGTIDNRLLHNYRLRFNNGCNLKLMIQGSPAHCSHKHAKKQGW